MTDLNTKIWVENYFRATRSGDEKVWADTFAKGAVVEDPVGTPALTSAEQLLMQGKAFLQGFAQIGLHESFIHTNGLEAVAMWEGRGMTHDGQNVSFKGIDHFEFNQDGKIVAMRGFWTPPSE